MLVIHPAFYLSSYILPRDPQGRLRSYKLLNRTIPCELVSDFVSSYPSVSRDPIKPHSVPVRDIQRLLALLYQWIRCFDSLNCFQSRLAVTANIHEFLWSNIHLNLISTGKDSIYLNIKNLLHTFLEKYWAFFPHIAHRLQPRSPSSSWTHL